MMKKVFAILAALALCLPLGALAQEDAYAAGDAVIFGSYEQDNDPTNGSEPLEWIVLKAEENRVMLITRWCIDAMAYNKDFVPMTWEKCTLRAWMNADFVQAAFTPDEQARLIPTQIVNEDNRHYSTPGGKDTTDRVFLLSLSEVYEYFPDQQGRTCKPTEYAKARGAFVNESNGNGWWWLRTPGVRPIDACGVRADGRVSGYGSRDVNRPSGSLRPVVWITTGP